MHFLFGFIEKRKRSGFKRVTNPDISILCNFEMPRPHEPENRMLEYRFNKEEPQEIRIIHQ